MKLRSIFVCATFLPVIALAPPSAHAQQNGESVESMIIEEEVPPVTASRLPIAKRELAATLNTVTEKTMQERGQSSFVDGLSNVAGVNPSLRYGGFDHLTIRGFGGNDFLILQDGFRDERHPVVGGEAPIGAMPGLDRIEVLKGPASVLYGVSALGGVINIVRKQPSAQASYVAGMRMGNYNERQSWIGATGPAATIAGRPLLYRFDAQTNSNEDFRGLQTRHAGAAGTLDYRISDQQQLTLRMIYLKSFFSTDAGLPTLGGAVPKNVDSRNRYNSPFDKLDYQDLRGQLGYSYQVSPNLSLHERFSITAVRQDYFSTETIGIAADNPTVLNRETFGFDHHMRPMMGNQLEARWSGLALVQHNLVGGYDFNYFRNRSPSGFSTLSSVSLLDPVENQGVSDFAFGRVSLDKRMMHGLFVADQLHLHEKLRLTLGARVDVFHRSNRRDKLDKLTGEVIERGKTRDDDVTAPSYRAGLVYLPNKWLTAYTGFSTSVRAALPSTKPADDRKVEPEVGRQVEAGVRLDPFAGRATLDLALFHIRKTNLVVIRPPTAATGEPVFEQAGAARSMGAEADLNVNLNAFRLTAGYAYTNAKYSRFDSDGTDYAGKFLRDVPRHSATFWGTYRTSHGFGAGFGGRLGGDAYVDDANDIRMPRYFIADASLFYERGPARLQFNARNIFDENILTSSGRYYTSNIYNQVTPGAPRLVSLQLALAF